MPKMHMVQALNQALDIALSHDDNVIILGEDVGVDGGVFRVTDELQAKHGEERVVDTPLAEAGIIGSSIGLAIGGMKPIAEIQFSGFSYQAFHQFKQHLARFHQRSHGSIKTPVIVRAPCAGGIRALEHHSESPETFFIHTQGLKVVMPSGPRTAKGLLLGALEQDDPVVFLEPKSIYRSFKEDVEPEKYTIALGTAETVREGDDFTILTWGAMTKLAKDSVEALQNQGYNPEIIDLLSLWPVDMETILESVKKTERVLILHEAQKTLGFGAELAARIQEEAIMHLAAPIKRVTSWDVPYPQFDLEKLYLPNTKRLVNAANELMDF